MKQRARVLQLLSTVAMLWAIANIGVWAACPNPPVINYSYTLPTTPVCPGYTPYAYVSADQGTYQWQISLDDGSTWSNISGATSNFLQLYSVTANMDGNQYRCVVTSSCGTTISSPTTLLVTQPPAITLAPSNTTGCVGASVSFQATASNSSGMLWQQSIDGGVSWFNLTGSTSSTLTISNVTACMEGYRYRAMFANSCVSITSSAAVLSVSGAPVIACGGNPTSVSVCPGGSAGFTADADGPTSTVQWQYLEPGGAWIDVPGATSSPLTVTGVTALMNGYQYRAIFTSSCGSTPTTPATLTVDQAPQLTADPSGSPLVCPGSSVSFTAAASGSPAPSLQWWVDDGSGWSPVPGAVSSPLTLFSVGGGMQGWQYRAVFTNDCGSATSAPATLNMNAPPVVTQNPATITPGVCAGTDVTFTAAATGSPTPTVIWQWHTNPNATTGWITLSGATTSTLTLTGVTHAMNLRYYRALYTNGCGSDASVPARLNVLPLAAVTFNPPNNAPVCPGSSVSFGAAANNDVSMLWQINTGSGWSTYTAGGTSSPLTLVNVTSAMNGYQYRAVFTNVCGETTNGLPATLSVYGAPAITDPVNTSACTGGNASFTATAAGTPAPTVQWQVSTNNAVSWTSIAGATSNTLSLNGVGMQMDGNQYRAIFTNSCGLSATSNPALLDVSATMAITAQPAASTTICTGGSVTLGVTATPGGLSYQWYRGTTAVGTDSPTLTISNATSSDAGTYHVVVTGTCANNSVTSSNAVLTVKAPPTISVSLASSAMPAHADNALHTVTFNTPTVTGTCTPLTVRLHSIVSSEVGTGSAPLYYSGASFTTADLTFQLRAQSNTTAGRTYTVTYRVTDAQGNTADASVTIGVPYGTRRADDPDQKASSGGNDNQSGDDASGSPSNPLDAGRSISRTAEGIAIGSVQPNPFTGETNIHYTTSEEAKIRLRIFDAEGTGIRSLYQGVRQAGSFEVVWNGMNDAGDPVPSGTYFVRMDAGNGATRVERVVLVR